tara:strand:+ start:3297 stop:4178 length:882 start_codon:yes stop_codon:yes gene_type:complete
MKILVSGAGGQLGQSLNNEIFDRRFEVVFYKKDKLDISKKIKIKNIIFKENPNVIINCAAYTNVEMAEKQKTLAKKINTDGVKYLAQICSLKNIFLIHISTDFVFDGKKNISYNVNDKTNPINYYGLSKLLGEKEIIKYCKKYIIIRTSWLFSEYGNNFFKMLLHKKNRNKRFKIVNDQIGNPTYAKDLSKTLIIILKSINESKKLKSGIYHYSGFKQCSWYDFACQINEYAIRKNFLKKRLNIEPISSTKYGKNLAKRPYFSSLNSAKIIKEFNLPYSKLENNIMQTIKNLK